MKKIFLWMENYLNKFRRVFVALVTLGILLFVTFGLLGGIAGLFAGDEEIDTTDQVLYFELSGVIVDQPQTGTPDPLTIILGGGDNPTSYALRDVLKVLESIAEDENLKAVYLDVDNLSMGPTSALAIADAIKNITDSGVRVISYTDGLATRGYLLASQASELYLNTHSYLGIDAAGFSRKREYMKDFYNNIKIDYEIFVAGDFKSGPEPYTRTNMSENDKIAWNAFADPLWNRYKNTMENGRDLESGVIQSYGDNFDILSNNENGDMPRVALNLGLVDGLMTHQEIRNYMIAEFGNGVKNKDLDEDEWPQGISYGEYLSTLDDTYNEDAEDLIAIINVEGVIMTGQEAPGTAGSDSIVEKINKAKHNDDVKAMI